MKMGCIVPHDSMQIARKLHQSNPIIRDLEIVTTILSFANDTITIFDKK
jgi:hypothetical protein